MKRRSLPGSFAALLAAGSMVVGSAASATPVASQINPLVALSAFGSAQSSAAMCAAGAASAAAAAAQAAGARPGCVLPVVDAAPPPPVVSDVPPPIVAEPVAYSPAPNFLPLLLGLGALAAAWFLLDKVLDDDDDGGWRFNVPPVSPA